MIQHSRDSDPFCYYTMISCSDPEICPGIFRRLLPSLARTLPITRSGRSWNPGFVSTRERRIGRRRSPIRRIMTGVLELKPVIGGFTPKHLEPHPALGIGEDHSDAAGPGRGAQPHIQQIQLAFLG